MLDISGPNLYQVTFLDEFSEPCDHIQVAEQAQMHQYCVFTVCDKLQQVVHVKSRFSAVSEEAGQDRKFVDTSSAVSHTPQWTPALTQG